MNWSHRGLRDRELGQTVQGFDGRIRILGNYGLNFLFKIMTLAFVWQAHLREIKVAAGLLHKPGNREKFRLG